LSGPRVEADPWARKGRRADLLLDAAAAVVAAAVAPLLLGAPRLLLGIGRQVRITQATKDTQVIIRGISII